MVASELDMWSEDIRVDVRTPLMILRIQENGLAKKTQGILRAAVGTTGLGDQVEHQLDLYAPALGYRETLLTARHSSQYVYPVIVSAKCFVPKLAENAPKPFKEWTTLEPNQRQAATEEEFVQLVRQVLQSPEARGLIQSLIARSNEVRPLESPEEDLPSKKDAPPGSPENGEN